MFLPLFLMSLLFKISSKPPEIFRPLDCGGCVSSLHLKHLSHNVFLFSQWLCKAKSICFHFMLVKVAQLGLLESKTLPFDLSTFQLFSASTFPKSRLRGSLHNGHAHVVNPSPPARRTQSPTARLCALAQLFKVVRQIRNFCSIKMFCKLQKSVRHCGGF